jgi:hypothetical protein
MMLKATWQRLLSLIIEGDQWIVFEALLISNILRFRAQRISMRCKLCKTFDCTWTLVVNGAALGLGINHINWEAPPADLNVHRKWSFILLTRYSLRSSEVIIGVELPLWLVRPTVARCPYVAVLREDICYGLGSSQLNNLIPTAIL